MILRCLGYRYSGAHVFYIFSSVVFCSKPSVCCPWERPLGLLDHAESLKLATAITADTEVVID